MELGSKYLKEAGEQGLSLGKEHSRQKEQQIHGAGVQTCPDCSRSGRTANKAAVGREGSIREGQQGE